jgi:tRNA C32,U32 (ribose-2'-O)-methylase TrmJ
MNLSHAVAVALYEMAGRGRYRPYAPRAASEAEIERMLASLEHLLLTLEYPQHRVKTTILAWRRVVGRGRMSTYEFHRIMGVISTSLKAMGAYPAPKKRWDPGPAFAEGRRDPAER